MSISGLILALFMPWVTGFLWLELLYSNFSLSSSPPRSERRTPGVLALLLGYGYLIGIFGTTLLIRVWNITGQHLEFLPIVALLLTLCILAILVRYITTGLTQWWQMPRLGRHVDIHLLGITLLLGVLGTRLAYLGMEIWLRPLFPWDAWSAWGQKTAVWFELRRLVEFADPAMWPGSDTQPIFTAPAFGYPATIPLIQVWTLLGLGQWNDAIMNLPWLLCWIALGLGMYGQARNWGISVTLALGWVYLLLSLPILDVHVAVAGYADLWLATSYGFMVMALLQWMRWREFYQVWLALLAAIVATQIKSEGVVWVITLLPTLLIAIGYRISLILKILVGFGLCIWGLYLSAPLEIEVPGLGVFILRADLLQIPGLPALIFKQHAITAPIIKHMFVMDNWHLLWWLVITVVIAGILRLRQNPVLIAAYITIMSSGGFLGLLFGITEFGQWVVQATILNRLLMHIVPGVLFITIIIVDAYRHDANQHSVPPKSPIVELNVVSVPQS